MIYNDSKSWPKQAAIVISDSPNMHMLLREMLRGYQWRVIDTIPNVQRAMSAVKEGMANLIIVDDTIEAPALSHMRYLLSNPISLTTPIISFVAEANESERSVIECIGQPATAEKPLTPSTFMPSFIDLVRLWEKPEYVVLRNAGYLLKAGHTIECFKLLLKCRDNQSTMMLATEALALILRKTGKIKDAEEMLITTLKKRKDIGVILSLADLYMHSSMPGLAHRLLSGVAKTLPNTVAFYPDLMQSALMKGCTDLAVEYLYHMRLLNYMPEHTASFLARILYSEGRISEAESILHNNKATFKKLKESWHFAENDRLDAVG